MVLLFASTLFALSSSLIMHQNRNFTIAIFLANFANKRNPCPKYWKCMSTAEGEAGVCKYDTNHGDIDYNRASRVFASLDINDSRTITFGDAHQGLHTLVPGASEKMIDKLTRNGDKNKDGSIDSSEYIAMYNALVDEASPCSPQSMCRKNPCRKMRHSCRSAKGYCHRHFKFYKPVKVVSQFVIVNQKRKKQLLGGFYDFPEGTMAIGRLDEDSEGLLLLTTDGKVSDNVRQKTVEKEYYAQVDGLITQEAIEQLTKGVEISEKAKKYRTLPCKASLFEGTPSIPDRHKKVGVRGRARV